MYERKNQKNNHCQKIVILKKGGEGIGFHEELILSEREYRHSEERFRLLSASAPIGIFLTDVEGSCIYVNNHWSEITGLSSDESLKPVISLSTKGRLEAM